MSSSSDDVGGTTEAPALRQVRAEKDLLQYRCLDVTVMLRNRTLPGQVLCPVQGKRSPTGYGGSMATVTIYHNPH